MSRPSGVPTLAPLNADGYACARVAMIAVALMRGQVVTGVTRDGTTYTAGPLRTACGEAAWALLAWPHGEVALEGDAYDVAAAFFAQLDADNFNQAWAVAEEAAGDSASGILAAFGGD